MDERKSRLVYWEASSRQDLKTFPVSVQKDFGVALYLLQLGGWPPDAKPWKGLGSGVIELRENARGDTFRVVLALVGDDAMHVLHAFQKKSRFGISTPKADVSLVEKRFKDLVLRDRHKRSQTT
jgi:phage-related protein